MYRLTAYTETTETTDCTDYRLPTTGNRLGSLVYYHKKDLTPYYGSRVSLSNQRRHNLVELVDCHKRLIAYAPADRLRR